MISISNLVLFPSTKCKVSHKVALLDLSLLLHLIVDLANVSHKVALLDLSHLLHHIVDLANVSHEVALLDLSSSRSQ